MSVAEKGRNVAGDARRQLGDHPVPSAFTAFGVGLGVGFLAVALLAESKRQREENFSERFLETLARAVPEALSRRVS